MLDPRIHITSTLARARQGVELVTRITARHLLGTHASARVRILDVVGMHALASLIVLPHALALTLGVIEHGYISRRVLDPVVAVSVREEIDDSHLLHDHFLLPPHRARLVLGRAAAAASVHVDAVRVGELERRVGRRHRERVRDACELWVATAWRCVAHDHW